MSERVFTLDEARELLPQLRELLQRVADLQKLVGDPATVRQVRRAAASNGGGSHTRDLLASADALAALLADVESLGVVLRDPGAGLVDFPAERDGRPIYLCWRVEEEDVGYWHSQDTGYAGREPL